VCFSRTGSQTATHTPYVQEPNGSEEEAVLLVERSKESRNPAIKRDLLAR